MLHDRDYMSGRRRFSADPDAGLKCLYALMGANIILFFLAPPYSPLNEQLALSIYGIKELRLWQPLTAMFLHASLFPHLFLNMFGLFMFGRLAAPLIGAGRFLGLFLFAGLAGNLLWLLPNLNIETGLVGASGAVMGVVMAGAMLMPNQEVYFIFAPYPVKLKTMAVIFILIDVFSELSAPPSGSNIAYLAHIGGFFGGYLYMRIFCRPLVEWDFLAPLFALFGFDKSQPRGWRIVTPEPPRSSAEPGKVSQAELDRMLDKISATGINSLSEAELETLRRAREQMKGR